VSYNRKSHSCPIPQHVRNIESSSDRQRENKQCFGGGGGGKERGHVVQKLGNVTDTQHGGDGGIGQHFARPKSDTLINLSYDHHSDSVSKKH